jgi:hypothetical protein
MDLTDERQKLQGSTREQRGLGVSFLQKALDVLGLGGEVSDNILDLVVKELYEYEGYYVGDIVGDEVARLDAYDAMLMAPLKFREKKERILQDLKEILFDDPFADEL